MNQTHVEHAAGPVEVNLEAGKQYYLCACGRSGNKPFCDGSHAASGIEPRVFTAEESKSAWLCACGRSANKPFCDGSHLNP